MQKLYANCMVKSKPAESGCLDVNVEEKWRVQMSQHFCSFSSYITDAFCLFVFVSLRPKSTAMVIAGRSVHLTTLFPGQA